MPFIFHQATPAQSLRDRIATPRNAQILTSFRTPGNFSARARIRSCTSAVTNNVITRLPEVPVFGIIMTGN